MSLRRMRDWVVEAKIYFTRTASYLNILNFLMIAIIFLNTTVWEYAFFQKLFPDRKMFLALGFVIVLSMTVVIGYLDTKLKLLHTEQARFLSPDRSPVMLPTAFQCAKMLSDLKRQGANTDELENQLDHTFNQFNFKKEFDFFKEKTK